MPKDYANILTGMLTKKKLFLFFEKNEAIFIRSMVWVQNELMFNKHLIKSSRWNQYSLRRNEMKCQCHTFLL